MSEYQYYEFQAIDRPLTEEEQGEVGSLSSRTDPTRTHAVFTYSYSDFRGCTPCASHFQAADAIITPVGGLYLPLAA